MPRSNSTHRVPAPAPTASMYGAPPAMQKPGQAQAQAPFVDLDVRNSQFDPNSLRNRPDSGFGSVYTKSVYGKGIYSPDLAQALASSSGSQTRSQSRDSAVSATTPSAGRSSYFASPPSARDTVVPPHPAGPRTFVPLKGSSSIPTLRAQSIQTQPENFVPSAWAPPVPSLPNEYAVEMESLADAGPSSQPFAVAEPAPAPAPERVVKKKKSSSSSYRTHSRGGSSGGAPPPVAVSLPSSAKVSFDAPPSAARPRMSLEEREQVAARLRSASAPIRPAFLDERAQAMLDIDLHPERYRRAQALTVLETPEQVRQRRAKMSGTRGREMDNWRSMHVYRPPGEPLTRIVKDEDKVSTAYFVDISEHSSSNWNFTVYLPPRPYTIEATSERGRMVATAGQKSAGAEVEMKMFARDAIGPREEAIAMGKDGVVKRINSFKALDLYRWAPGPRGTMQCEHTVTGEVIANFRPTTAVSKIGELKINPAHDDVLDLVVASAIARTEQLGVGKGFHPGRFVAKLFVSFKAAPPIAVNNASHIGLPGTVPY